jgi:hypothetical protein
MFSSSAIADAFRGFNTANQHATTLAKMTDIGWRGARAVRVITISMRMFEEKGDEDEWYGRSPEGLPKDSS